MQTAATACWIILAVLHTSQTVPLQAQKDTRQGVGWLLRMPRAGGSSGNQRRPEPLWTLRAPCPQQREHGEDAAAFP